MTDKKIMISTMIALVLITLAAGCILPGQSENKVTYIESRLDAGGANVVIPVTDIADSSFHYYSYDFGGTTIKFFIVKDKSGSLHAAFDACDVCYDAKKGYSKSGDNAKCNNCGKTFAITGIGSQNVAGGCWPGYLAYAIQGNDVVIKVPDLQGGKHYFV